MRVVPGGDGRCQRGAPGTGTLREGEATKEGRKTVYHGKYTDKTCTRESSKTSGKYEWSPGPGTEQSSKPRNVEPGTLQTTGGNTIACADSKQFGEFLAPRRPRPKSASTNARKTRAENRARASRPEESPPTPEEGTIISNPAEAEVGLVSGGSKPKVGWSYKAKTGSALFQVRCGKTTGLGTKVTIEGSFIGVVSKVVDRMGEEDKMRYTAASGSSHPRSSKAARPTC